MTKARKDISKLLSMLGKQDPNDGTTMLSQDDIDSLLGIEDKPKLISPWIGQRCQNQESLPGLQDIITDFCFNSSLLARETCENVEVSLDQISAIYFGDYMNSIPLPASFGVIYSEQLKGYGIIVIDSALIYSWIVNVTHEQDIELSGYRIANSEISDIDINLTQLLYDLIVVSLNDAFKELNVSFVLKRIEYNPRFALVVKPSQTGVLVKTRFDFESWGGRCGIFFPDDILSSIANDLKTAKLPEVPQWETDLKEAIFEVDMDLVAVIATEKMPLFDIIQWKIGDRLLFDKCDPNRITMSVHGKQIGDAERVPSKYLDSVKLVSILNSDEVKK